MFDFFSDDRSQWDDTLELDGRHGLVVGAGDRPHPQWVNMDIRSKPGIDVVHDILTVPWPFESREFDLIVCEDVLEHIPRRCSYVSEKEPTYSKWFSTVGLPGECHNLVIYEIDCFVPVMEEIGRIVKKGGNVLVKVPVPGEEYDLSDPTHARRIAPDLFKHWDPDDYRYGRSFDSEYCFEVVYSDKVDHNYRIILEKTR